MEGYLKKEGHFFKTWQRRFFSLSSSSEFFYYVDEQKLIKKGSYVLDCESSCNVIEDSKGHVNMFVLQAKGDNKYDTIILSADSAEDRAMWITELNRLISELRESVNLKHRTLLAGASVRPP